MSTQSKVNHPSTKPNFQAYNKDESREGSPPMASRRSLLLYPAVVGICSVLGGLYGPGVTGVAAASEDDVSQTLKTFTKVYTLVEGNFADKVTSDKGIYKGAVTGMLRTLDPHSSFFDPKDYNNLREDQKGHYYGVGMQVAERNHQVVVIAPFLGSPAYKAGLRPGDTILEVNDKRTTNMSVSEVAELLKGPKGTSVQVIAGREGSEKSLTFNITRDEIPRKSVQDAFFVKPGILHLDIESFNENTSREVEDNMKRVGEQNVKGLILDLRENPGGLLNEGVAIAGRFLQNGQVVVSHRGRASAEKPYLARNGSPKRDYPIVCLVNRYSASAAEIVSGALQDHDRALILGENTFGKGLVQTVFPLAEGTGLALTTAKYYTPSNRLIQRDYSSSSFLDYYYRKNVETQNTQDVAMTDSGRKVYGGGGIAPDVKFVPEKLNKFQIELLRKYTFFSFTSKFFSARGDTKLPQAWELTDQVFNDFHAFLLKEKVDFSEADFAANKDWAQTSLKREIFLTAFGTEESRKLGVQNDPMILKAIEVMPKAKQLVETSKKLIVQRTGGARD